ncbi:hypothetical protein [Serratia proteamaculans]
MKNYSLKIEKIMRLACDNDTDDFFKELMQWHFSPETGTDFWLGVRENLNFDPCTSIKGFRDLHQLSDISGGLHNVPVAQLIPRGIPKELPHRMYEFDGKMGGKKHVIAYDEWMDMLITWRMSGYQHRPGRPAGNTLATFHAGSMFLGEIYRKRAERLGGQFFSIKSEPEKTGPERAEGDATIVSELDENVVKQAVNILASEHIRFLVTTPSLFRELLRRRDVVSEMKKSLAQVTLDGAEINLDELKSISRNIFPDCEFSASYGSSSTLNVARSLLITADSEHIIYESFSPFITYNVIDNDTLRPVNYGERGRVSVTHISPYAFFPHVVERETAIRLPGLSKLAGDRLADIEPMNDC